VILTPPGRPSPYAPSAPHVTRAMPAAAPTRRSVRGGTPAHGGPRRRPVLALARRWPVIATVAAVAGGAVLVNVAGAEAGTVSAGTLSLSAGKAAVLTSANGTLNGKGRATFQLPRVPNGGGAYFGLQTRATNSSTYLARVHVYGDGTAIVGLSKTTDRGEQRFGDVRVAGMKLSGAPTVTVETKISGTDPVTLAVRTWAAGSPVPGWQYAATDNRSDRITRTGAFRPWAYLSTSATGSYPLRFADVTWTPATVTLPPSTSSTTRSSTSSSSSSASSSSVTSSSVPAGTSTTTGTTTTSTTTVPPVPTSSTTSSTQPTSTQPTSTTSTGTTTTGPSTTSSSSTTRPTSTSTSTTRPTSTTTTSTTKPSTSTTAPSTTTTAPVTTNPAPAPGQMPNADTTGVPAGTPLTVHQGDLTITTAGAVYDSLDVRGFVYVRAPNVTIRRSILRGGSVALTQGGNRGVVTATDAGARNLVIEDSEIRPSVASPQVDGITGGNFTLRRVEINGGVDTAKIFKNNVVIESSWLHGAQLQTDPYSGEITHNDGVQVLGGTSIKIHNSRIEGANNAAIMVSQEAAPTVGLDIQGNWLDGGGCTINIVPKDLDSIGPVVLADNLFGHNTRVANCSVARTASTNLVASDNVYSDSGAAVKINVWN
jgi:hypothetical protein